MKTGRILTVNPDYKEKFLDLLSSNFPLNLKSHDCKFEGYISGMVILTSKRVPIGEVWASNVPLEDESGKGGGK